MANRHPQGSQDPERYAQKLKLAGGIVILIGAIKLYWCSVAAAYFFVSILVDLALKG
jgi:hypothetical protein